MSRQPPILLVTGGGSGGHVMPALAVALHAQAHGWQVVYVGSNSGLEAGLVAPTGLRYRGISGGKLRRYFSWTNVTDAFRVLWGVLQAIFLMGQERPTVVFSKGGFVAFPVVLAAWLWRIPVVAHESDATQGLANRLSAPFTATLCLSFPDTVAQGARGRVVFTGTPVRPELLAGDALRGRALLGVPATMRVLLVTGGSLGAEAVNAAVVAALPELDWFVVHVCGPGKVDRSLHREHYRAFEFVGADWADMLAAADLVVSRAGANTLFELLVLGKPNLLIPLPQAGSRGDQLENAAYAAAAGFSVVLPQHELTPASLVAGVAALGADLPGWRERLAGFSPPASLAAILTELEAYRIA